MSEVPTPKRITGGHGDKVIAVAFFKDGRRFVTGSYDKTLRIWDVKKQACVGGPFEGHTRKVESVAISPDERRIASCGDDEGFVVWDIDSKEKVTFPCTAKVFSVCFSPDGKKLASGSRNESVDGDVVIWDAKTRAILATLQGHDLLVNSVVFSPDGLKLASASSDCTIRVWCTDENELLFKIRKAHVESISTVLWSPDGQQLLSGSNDSTVKFWNSYNGNQIGQPCTHLDTRCWFDLLAISSDGSFIVTALSDTVRLWSTKTHQQIGPTLISQGSTGIAISPNGELLVIGDDDGNVWFQPIKDIVVEGRIQDEEEVQRQRQQLLALSGTQLRSDDNQCDLLGVPTPKRVKRGHKLNVTVVAFFKDGQRFVTGSRDKTLRIWDVEKKKFVGGPLVGHKEEVRWVTISPNQRQIASCGKDKTIILWDAARSKQNLVFYYLFILDSVCFSPDGKKLASGSRDNKVIIWDAETRDMLAILEGHKHFVWSVAFSPDGRKLASGSGDNIRVWCTDSNKLLFKIDGDRYNNNAIRSVVWLPDGLQLLSTSFNCIVRFWDSHNGNQIGQPCTPTDYRLISSFVISFDGSFVATAAGDTVDLWSTKTRQQIAPTLISQGITGIAISPNGELLVIGDDDGNVWFRSIKDILDPRSPKWDNALQGAVKLAMIAFEDGQYIEAANQFNNTIPAVTDIVYPMTPFKPISTALGGDLPLLWRTINQRRCEAFLRTDRVIEAVESHQYMMSMIEEAAKPSCLEWSTTFKQDCMARCVAKGEDAAAASDYKMAIDMYSAAIVLDSSRHSIFARCSKAKLAQNLYAEALHDADKVIELDPSSHVGYDLKHAALHGARRYDEAVKVLQIMLSKLDGSPDAQIRKLRQQYGSPSDVEYVVRRAIHSQLENAPIRLINTSTGNLCDRQAQIRTFKTSAEHNELLYSSIMDANLQTKHIEEAVEAYFRWAMLSHRWESKEPLLHDIQDTTVYDLDEVGTVVKLQTFCKIARDAGYQWAWSDTCCIDQKNNVELQESVNSMFVWYHLSALTIVYLSDVCPLSKSGTLANSVWNTRGWTVQEFLAPRILLFYQADWTPYLDDISPNHKESVVIMQELEDSTGIDAQALVSFRPGMRDAREKLQWASSRVTTLQEDIAYSLFGMFGVHLPVIYGEKKQNALGRLLQEIIAHSGDITALDWVGKASSFNSCLPADIVSYKAPPCTLPSLSEDKMQTSVLELQHDAAVVKSASIIFTRLDNLSAPRFSIARLQLPCIAFHIREVRRRRGEGSGTCFTYDVKADGLQDLVIRTEDKLIQFLRTKHTTSRQTFFLVLPWNRHNLGLPDFADDTQSVDGSVLESPLEDSFSESPGENEPVDLDSQSRELRLIIRLAQPFAALLLAQQRGGEYKRIASDHNIIAEAKDIASVCDAMDIRTLEIL
ncbi:WD40-repeat-containing domain protein [Suillus clintonianus]|uniref:WD40-repeat-containing domain protein n=1 Tax=Suillus clintonianus TaxID=1904413 RepID=UPI001B86AE68|nr:WD40-repeat-containing domain protein [Suillus clintonianus]KAG2151526.1 WD40-repeat-containing domain protein [Suillus clintonianus]